MIASGIIKWKKKRLQNVKQSCEKETKKKVIYYLGVVGAISLSHLNQDKKWYQFTVTMSNVTSGDTKTNLKY